MNVEELLSLVRACIFQDEPTFLEGFHDAVETAVFCAGWCCESCCDAAARESLAKNGLCMRVWMTAAFGAKRQFVVRHEVESERLAVHRCNRSATDEFRPLTLLS